MEVAYLTDMGRVREINEDSCCHMKLSDGCDLLMVADGMGGHNAGEVASMIAVKSITDYIKLNIKNDDGEKTAEVINQAIQKANTDIYDESIQNQSYSGMGTTVTCAIVCNDIICIGHVGDSRAYILKGGKLRKITNDHSLVAELVKNGTITEAEAMHHPQKNIITRALGIENQVEVDIEKVGCAPGDIFLLCTDGLTNMLEEEKIEGILNNMKNPTEAAKKLIDEANDAGGYDNITVVIGREIRREGEVR